MPPSKLGPYEIEEPLGKGGMGEVYRAHDPNLKRDVAIKVLPPEMASDPERLARLEREAHLLAALNHPNVATIHGLEEDRADDGTPSRFLVLELIEGETLEERLRPGPLGVGEAMELAVQIARGLEAAHGKGVVHRDLKPANVKITPDGLVKILDFGLAKPAEAVEGEADDEGLTHSPTVTVAGTEAGVILGTAAYMSPEQARGLPVDWRTDIWSFGCVLYEMLTGERPFQGDTVTDVLAAIVKEEVDWTLLPAETPAATRRLLHRCAQKSRTERLQHMGDARIEIDSALDEPDAPPAGIPETARAPLWRRALPWGVALAATAFGVWAVSGPSSPISPGPARHLSIPLEPGPPLDLRGDDSAPLAIAPDGTTIAYQGLADAESGGGQLYLRDLDERDARAIPAAAGIRAPFFSLDGRWVAYTSQEKLWKTPVTGGAPIQIAATTAYHGATWADDETIIISGPAGTPLHSVPAAGGESQPLTRLDTAAGEQGHASPAVLPGGRGVLFTVWKGDSYAESSIGVASLDTGEHDIVLDGGSHPVYVSTGHMLYSRRDELLAVPFDLDTLRATGTPIPVLDEIMTLGGVEAPLVAVSTGGVLAYVRHEPWTWPTTLVRVDRDGDVTEIEGPTLPTRPTVFRLSRDGRKVAFMSNGPYDIWTYDLAEEHLNKVTIDAGFDGFPVWTDDDAGIVFSSGRSGGLNLWHKPADGIGDPEELLPPVPANRVRAPLSSSPDGAIAYLELSPTSGYDIWLLPSPDDPTPVRFAATPATENEAEFSPDGEALAYVSNETGEFEIYVEPVPQTGVKRKVSRNGGSLPLWSRDGSRLFWVSPDREVRVATLDDESTLTFGAPELFMELPETVQQIWPIDTAETFLGVSAEPAPRIDRIEVVLDFFEELERLVRGAR